MINTQDDFDPKLRLAYDCVIKALRKHLESEIELWDEHLPKIVELSDKFKLVEEPELRKLALDFLRESEIDMCSCEILYRNNVYPHATYHFQQAVEKASKGYMWGFGFLGRDDRIRFHESPKLFLMILEKMDLFAWLESLPETRIGSLMLKAKRILTNPENPGIARWSYEEISEHLSSIDSSTNNIRVMVEEVFDCVSARLNIKSENIEKGKATLTRALLSAVVLCLLSIIMLPHEAYTRYPDRNVKPDEYTSELGVVKAIPKMMKYLQPEVEGLIVIISEQSK